jgi:hypothetical protein
MQYYAAWVDPPDLRSTERLTLALLSLALLLNYIGGVVLIPFGIFHVVSHLLN